VFKVADCKKRDIGVKGGKDVKWVEDMCELHGGKIVAAYFKDPCIAIVLLDTCYKQETPQCDETRFSTIQPSIDMTEIRNERWQ